MASIKIKLFKGKKYANGEHPIVLQVIDGQTVLKISLGMTCSQPEWNDDLGRYSRKHRSFKRRNTLLDHFEEKGERVLSEIILDGRQFSPELFRERFNEKQNSGGLIELLRTKVDELETREKYGTMSSYKSSLNVLLTFTGKTEISFQEVDYDFLIKFEQFLFDKGNTEGGVHHHMRNIRSVFNDAIRRGYCDTEDYPFSNPHKSNGYSLARVKSKTKPRALTEEDLEKLKSLDIEEIAHVEDSYLFFMFSFYTRGMNFSDMAKLSQANLKGGRIIYTRQKTGAQYSIKVSSRISEIIHHFKDESSPYLFPILNAFHQTELQKKRRIQKRLRKVNRDLKEIGELIECSIPLTTYVARHTWATTLRRKGYATEIISQGLGHTELNTTKSYLESFDDVILDQTDADL